MSSKPNVLGWCGYCKDPVFEDDTYEVEGSEIFHPDCLCQMNTFHNSLDDNEEDVTRQDCDPDFDELEGDGTDN